jgi:sugar phosphate isomerase/epimerase
MKLAVFTDEVSQDLEVAVQLAARFNLDGVELRSVWSKPVQHLSEEEVARVGAMLDQRNLRVAAIASPVFKCELDDESEQQEHLDDLRSCIRLAKEFDTQIIRIFAFWKRGPSKPVWQRIKDQFRPAVPIAEDAGIILGLENESSTYLATAAETRQFITEMDSPVLKSVWDPCNEVCAEEGITAYPDAYRLVEPWVVHVHVKDAKWDPGAEGPQVTPVGDGAVDWKGQFRELLAKKYEGYASLETHWRAQALSEEQMNRPGGEAFSEAGEYASDVCMRNMMKILAEARREANQG